MSGIIGSMPLIIKKDDLIRIMNIEDVYDYHTILSHIRIWSNEGWSQIEDIKKERTEKKIYRVSNTYNWIYITEDAKFLLNNNELIEVKNIKKDSNLFQVDFPKSEVLDLPDPNIFGKIPEKRKIIPVSEFDRKEIINGNIKITRGPKIIHNKSEVYFIDRVVDLFMPLKVFRDELPCFECPLLERGEQSEESCNDYCYNHIDILYNLYLDCYINSKDKEAAKQALLLFRNNFEPYRILVWDFNRMQKIMILASKVGFDPRSPDSGNPMYIRFKLTLESYREDMAYAGNISEEDFQELLRDYYPKKYIVYSLYRKDNRAYDTRTPSDHTNPLKYVCMVLKEDGTSEYKYIFDYKKEYVYDIKTENGFYQAGVGKFILKG